MVAVVERTLAILALVAAGVAVVTAVVTVATAGPLYLSEVAGYVPCTLCW